MADETIDTNHPGMKTLRHMHGPNASFTFERHTGEPTSDAADMGITHKVKATSPGERARTYYLSPTGVHERWDATKDPGQVGRVKIMYHPLNPSQSNQSRNSRRTRELYRNPGFRKSMDFEAIAEKIVKADNTVQYKRHIAENPWKTVAKGCGMRSGTLKKAVAFVVKDWPAHGFESPSNVTRQRNKDWNEELAYARKHPLTKFGEDDKKLRALDDKRVKNLTTGRSQIDQEKYAVTPEKRLESTRSWRRHQYDIQPQGGDRNI